MHWTLVFFPHLLFSLGFIVWSVRVWLAKRNLITSLQWAVAYVVLFFTGVALAPDRLMRAAPTRSRNAETAILLGFGYEMDGERMLPGSANQALLDWTLRNHPEVKLLLVQEGVWDAADPQVLSKRGIRMERIHRHDPAVYLNTFETAYCAIQKMQEQGVTQALLVAHELQLARAAADFRWVAEQIYPAFSFLVPDLRGIPYPARSVHWHTRNSYAYKLIELLVARPRDWFSPLPDHCKAPE